MFRSLVRTSWQHMTRTRYISFMVIIGFTVLFLTVFTGLSMVKLLWGERDKLTQNFTYPLFINNLYTFQSPRIRDFVQSLVSAGITGNIQYVSREQALDQEVQKNPDILSALGGENPLPDMIMVPLYGTDITVLWTRIQEFRDIFDSVQSFETLRSRLKRFDTSMERINHIVSVLWVFLGLTGILMFLLIAVMIRYQARLFRHERIIGHLVGAHPFYFWWPHVITMSVYALAGLFLAYVIFSRVSVFL